MQFVFFCPVVKQTFTSSDFELTDNRGVQTDANGNRFLDATVVLTTPCPLCQALHRYRASELSCPFQPPATDNHPD